MGITKSQEPCPGASVLTGTQGTLPGAHPWVTCSLRACKQASLEGGGRLVGALGRRHPLQGGVVVMHHGGDTVAHGSFVAPGGETGRGHGQVSFAAHAAVKTHIVAMIKHPWDPWPAPRGQAFLG